MFVPLATVIFDPLLFLLLLLLLFLFHLQLP
jgi:hypothetical protein